MSTANVASVPAGAKPAAGASAGGPGPRKKPPQEPLKMSTVAKLGRKYFGRRPLLVVAYILVTLLYSPTLALWMNSELSQLTTYFQKLANSDQGPANPTAPSATPPPSVAPAPAGEDTGAPKEITKQQLLPTLFTWIGLTLAYVICGFGLKYLTAYMTYRVANEIREDAFESVLHESPRFFFEQNADRLTTVINQYSNVVTVGLRQLLIDPILQVIALITIGYSLYLKLATPPHSEPGQPLPSPLPWEVPAAIGLVALASPFLVALMAKLLERDASAAQEKNIAASTLVGGALKAVEEVQAMRAEPIFQHKQSDLLKSYLLSMLRQTATVEKTNVLNRLPGDLVLAFVIGFAVYSVLVGHKVDAGTIMFAVTMVPQFMGAVQGLAGFSINKSMSAPPISIIHKILSGTPEVVVRAGAQDFESVESRIEVRDLTFSYRPGVFRNVLDHVSFSLPPGKVTGLVARPGQGKTTFFRLALRFYDPQGGEIIIGGRPTTDFTLDSLRRHIVLMSQFPAFFYDTIRENFLIAKPTATDEEIRSLALQTPLWSVLEQNFGTDPLDRPFAAGGPLSGGQKKLFALTRCLLRSPTFLFLDEPTTGMGPKDKFPLIDVMRKACAGKTTVVVDHDIAWQSHFCDHIVVLSEGKVIQEGPPSLLRNQPGLFKELFDMTCEGCIGPKPANT
jgi:ABC-type multidrug transport system fused ATPase/permease subunit